jgi:Flp pilus assembly protein TadB
MMPMLTTSTGRWLLTYAAGSIIVGYVILMKIADIEY